MLHIILTVLRIIGIILLAVLALILVLLLTVLFAPLRYRADVKWDGQERSERYADVTVDWLLHLLSFRFRYERGRKSGRLKVAWKTIRQFGSAEEPEVAEESEAPNKTEVPEKMEDQTEATPALIEGSRTDQTHAEQNEEKRSDKKEEKRAEKQPEKAEKKAVKTEKKAEKSEKKAVKAEKKAEKTETKVAAGKRSVERGAKQIKRKSQALFGKIVSIPAQIGRAITAFWEAVWYSEDRVDALVRKIEQLIRKIEPFLDAEATALYRKVWGWLRDMLRHCRVRRIQGRLAVGTGDAAYTGWLTGIFYLILPASAEDFELLPEFYERQLDADLSMKGRIRLIHPTIFAVKLLLQKEFRTLLKRRHRS